MIVDNISCPSMVQRGRSAKTPTLPSHMDWLSCKLAHKHDGLLANKWIRALHFYTVLPSERNEVNIMRADYKVDIWSQNESHILNDYSPQVATGAAKKSDLLICFGFWTSCSQLSIVSRNMRPHIASRLHDWKGFGPDYLIVRDGARSFRVDLPKSL